VGKENGWMDDGYRKWMDGWIPFYFIHLVIINWLNSCSPAGGAVIKAAAGFSLE